MLLDNLIEHLAQIRKKRGNIRVGTFGHYGKFYAISKLDIGTEEVMSSEEDGYPGERIIDITLPDIGPVVLIKLKRYNK